MAVRAASGGILPARCIRGHVALSEGRTEGSVSKVLSTEAFGEMASGVGGTLRRTVRQGFRRKASEGGIRQGFGSVPEGLSVGLRGHVSSSERAPKGFIGRLSKGLPEDFSGGWHRCVSLEINDSGVNGDFVSPDPPAAKFSTVSYMALLRARQ